MVERQKEWRDTSLVDVSALDELSISFSKFDSGQIIPNSSRGGCFNKKSLFMTYCLADLGGYWCAEEK